MPEFKGFAQRQEDDREAGAAKILIGFPDAVTYSITFDAASGAIKTVPVPNPHQKAMGLDDLRQVMKSCAPGSTALAFYADMEKKLISHIESTVAAVTRPREADAPALGLDLSLGLAT